MRIDSSNAVASNADLGQVIDDAASFAAGEVVGEALGKAMELGMAAIASDFLAAGIAGQALGALLQGNTPVSPPVPQEASNPPGTLQTSPDGTITTPGGYKIQATGQYEWKVTGPDGKTTRVWGDPHVDESEGGKWDFQRNSTFVLGDGTRINVSTEPWGNAGAHVTSNLEIINGNDRVTVDNIDKGKGQVSQVTQDGYAHVNDFGGADVFVEGPKSDQWSFNGKEILGGSTATHLTLGKDLQPVNDVTNQFGGGLQWAERVLSDLFKLFSDFEKLNQWGDNPYQRYPQWPVDPLPNWQRAPNTKLGGYQRAFHDVGTMLQTLGDWARLNSDVKQRPFYA